MAECGGRYNQTTIKVLACVWERGSRGCEEGWLHVIRLDVLCVFEAGATIVQGCRFVSCRKLVTCQRD